MRRFLSAAVVLGLACAAWADEGEKKKRGETPEDAFLAIRECMLDGKTDEMWGWFSKGTHKMIIDQMGAVRPMLDGAPAEEKEKLAKDMGLSVEEMGKLSDEEFAKKMMAAQMKKLAEDEDEKKKMKETKWKSADVKGDRAVCVTVEPDGKEETIVMVKEEGVWRFDIPETEKLKEGGDEEGGDEGGDEGEEEEEGSDK